MNVIVRSRDKEELVLDVSGTINSASAKEFQRLVEQARDVWPLGRLVLDVDKVAFFSSAGLRVLLRLEKAALLRIINASATLMEVFQDTGFTSIMDIRFAGPLLRAQGPSRDRAHRPAGAPLLEAQGCLRACAGTQCAGRDR